jgi:hypothetical protein
VWKDSPMAYQNEGRILMAKDPRGGGTKTQW